MNGARTCSHASHQIELTADVTPLQLRSEAGVLSFFSTDHATAALVSRL